MKRIKEIIEHFEVLSSSEEQKEELELLKKEIFDLGRTDHTKASVAEAFGYTPKEMKTVYNNFINSCCSREIIYPSRAVEHAVTVAQDLRELLLIVFHFGYFEGR